MRCTTFCFVCFYQPAFCRVCVFILWTSCLLINTWIKLNCYPKWKGHWSYQKPNGQPLNSQLNFCTSINLKIHQSFLLIWWVIYMSFHILGVLFLMYFSIYSMIMALCKTCDMPNCLHCARCSSCHKHIQSPNDSSCYSNQQQPKTSASFACSACVSSTIPFFI